MGHGVGSAPLQHCRGPGWGNLGLCQLRARIYRLPTPRDKVQESSIPDVLVLAISFPVLAVVAPVPSRPAAVPPHFPSEKGENPLL